MVNILYYQIKSQLLRVELLCNLDFQPLLYTSNIDCTYTHYSHNYYIWSRVDHVGGMKM